MLTCSRQSTKEKKQTDQSADVSHEPSSDDLALKEQPAAMATKVQRYKWFYYWLLNLKLQMTAKANYSNRRRPVLHRQEQREAKKMSRDNSKMDLNGYHLKSDFGTIVRNKDEEI